MKEHWNQLLETLAPMSWPKRLEHLWTYYKWVPLALAGLIIALSMVITAVVNLNTRVLVAGLGLNVPASEELQTAMTDQLYSQLGGSDWETVRFSTDTLNAQLQGVQVDAAYATVAKVTGLIGAGELDYMLLDEEALGYYRWSGLFAQLNTLFPAQTLAGMPVQALDGMPILLALEGTWFQETFLGNGTYYLAYIRDPARPEACQALWNYLRTGKVHP